MFEKLHKRFTNSCFRAIQNRNEFAVESLISAGGDVGISNINGKESSNEISLNYL